MIGDRWGVTDQEVALGYPCDALVPQPGRQLWRGVTVAAAPAQVWPWLCQLRRAPYSYDWVDNFGRRSPRTCQVLPDPQPGDSFSCIGGRFPVGRVLSATHQQQLTATIMGAVMSYQLVPSGDSTRLLLKIVTKQDGLRTRALCLGDWPMARRQLLNLRALAEQQAPLPG
jgi:hypothetical protein